MELYKRSHPHKPRRNCHQYQEMKKPPPNSGLMPEETKRISSSHLPRDSSHHRLHCPGLLECDHCSNSRSSSFSNIMKLPNRAVAAHKDCSTTASLINDDEDFDCGCENLNLHLIHMPSSSPLDEKHLDFGCECGGTNYKDDNDNGVKTLANCCDTLGRRPLEQEQIVQPRPTSPARKMMTRWRDGLSNCIHRGMTLFSGSTPLPFRRGRSSSSSVLISSTQWTKMTSFLYTFAILLITCLPCLPVSYACSSRSTPKPRPPSPTLRPNITIQTYTCPPEYDAHYCLNGATCFTVKIGESILYNCECAEGYMGQRCEFKDLDGSYLPSKQRAMLEQAGVSGAVAIVVILVVVVLGYAYVRQSRKKSLARHARETGDQVDGFVYERRPFSQYYYNNPSISISQDLHRQSRSSRGDREKDDFPLDASGSASLPTHHPHSPQRPGSSMTTPTSSAPVVPLHSTNKPRPPDPPRRTT